MEKIRIGIVGYGNIGRGVEQSIKRNDDMELKAVFTRRDPASVSIQTEGAVVKHFDDMEAMKDEIDVMILCGGSATDLPVIGPKVAASFNTIDSFDTHARIPDYFASVDKAAKEGGNIGIISVGWDPGMFSLNRLYAESILVQGSTYTFWGKGVSQGHSDAIRRIEGVKNAIQYTVPIESAMEQVRSGSEPALTTREKHLRECYVVAEEGADKAAIEKAIKTMPNYFDVNDDTFVWMNVSACTKVYKRKFLEDNHLSFYGVRRYEDEGFMYRCLACHPVVELMAYSGYYYYMNSESITRSSKSDRTGIVKEYFQTVNKLADTVKCDRETQPLLNYCLVSGLTANMLYNGQGCGGKKMKELYIQYNKLLNKIDRDICKNKYIALKYLKSEPAKKRYTTWLILRLRKIGLDRLLFFLVSRI